MQRLAQLTYEMLGIRLSDSQVGAFRTYQAELLDWNTRFNLTAIQHPEQVLLKHFLDSLTCALVISGQRGERGMDVGTGAGFPGLPLKILYPGLQLMLVESVAKKAAFCEHIISKLNLENVSVLKLRAEEVGQLPEHREAYDWVTARAVAVMPVLAEYLLPLVRLGGQMIAMKGETAHAEAHAAEHAYRMLGGSLQQVVPVTLPGVAEQRYLVVVRKIAATPPDYPRRIGIPAKRPLHSSKS